MLPRTVYLLAWGDVWTVATAETGTLSTMAAIVRHRASTFVSAALPALPRMSASPVRIVIGGAGWQTRSPLGSVLSVEIWILTFRKNVGPCRLGENVNLAQQMEFLWDAPKPRAIGG